MAKRKKRRGLAGTKAHHTTEARAWLKRAVDRGSERGCNNVVQALIASTRAVVESENADDRALARAAQFEQASLLGRVKRCFCK